MNTDRADSVARCLATQVPAVLGPQGIANGAGRARARRGHGGNRHSPIYERMARAGAPAGRPAAAFLRWR